MIKKSKYAISGVVLISLLSTGFVGKNMVETEKLSGFHIESEEVYDYTVLSEEETGKTFYNLPYTGKSFIAFKEALAIKESMGLYHLVNPYGYMGKYQFGKTTLKAVGVSNTSKFLKDPVLQEKAFKALVAKNKWELRKEIRKYEGKVVSGIKITESGLIAAAHLGGAGSVKKFLYSGHDFEDGFGTSIRTYLKRFGGYDTSIVVANKNAKVKA